MSHGEAPLTAPVDLLQQDRDRYADPVDPAIEIVGVDPEDRAVSYAVDAGLIDAGVAINFEKREPAAQDVTEISLERLLNPDNGTWMTHCSGAGK